MKKNNKDYYLSCEICGAKPAQKSPFIDKTLCVNCLIKELIKKRAAIIAAGGVLVWVVFLWIL